MCGIAGLYLKNPSLYSQLGKWFKPMLVEMTSRGPDSAGVAVYRNTVAEDQIKYSLAHDSPHYDWQALQAAWTQHFKNACIIQPIHTHAIVVSEVQERYVKPWLQEFDATLRLVGSGRSVEIYKETGLPEDVYTQFQLEHAVGQHMIGHTRMATESAVTTAGSHPFATGADVCLVHNGSLSNHNRLREELKRQGMTFSSENDSEVAAAYLTWKLRQGCSLREALEQALSDLDGFYTFCVGTQDGFAILRDPIACKHAVIAETSDWVAMATEFRAIATLPGAEHADIWEPSPATVYHWGAEVHTPDAKSHPAAMPQTHHSAASGASL